MSLKDLQKYQENGRRTPTEYSDQQVSYEEELKQEEIRMERRKEFKVTPIKTAKRIERSSEEALEDLEQLDEMILNEIDYLTYNDR